MEKEIKRMRELIRDSERFVKENLPIGFSGIANMDTEEFLLFKKAMSLYGDMKEYLITVDDEYVAMKKELDEIREQNKELLNLVKDMQATLKAMNRK